jgi:hypothetical protein
MHDFIQRSAKIHCKLAEFALKSGDLNRAMEEADFSIENDPDYLKVYIPAYLEMINIPCHIIVPCYQEYVMHAFSFKL